MGTDQGMSETVFPLAVIVPVYGNAVTLEEMARRVRSALDEPVPDYRLLFVVDGSPDESWSIVQGLSMRDTHNLGLLLEGNIGQHRALLAGIAHLQADYYAVLDADLQDPPELLRALVEQARKRMETVFTIRKGAYQSWGRMATSRMFKGALGLWTGLPWGAGTYLVFPRSVAAAMLRYRGPYVHVVVMARRFSESWSFLCFRREMRKQGESAYSLLGRCRAAWTAACCAWTCRKGV